MRVVFINACHPDTSHICGVRARAFGDAMSLRGHQIVLLTPPIEEMASGDDLTLISGRLTSHNWNTPFRISAPYDTSSILPKLRRGAYLGGIRQTRIAFNYWWNGNIYQDWIIPAQPYLEEITNKFRPNLIWAIFGHTGCWKMAQNLAKRAHCPWIMDVKDSWTSFIPTVFRTHLAKRFSDAAYMTTLSSQHGHMLKRWCPSLPQKVIYSGMPKSLLFTTNGEEKPKRKANTIFLFGSIYDVEGLKTIFESLRHWLVQNGTEKILNLRIAYAGADEIKFKFATEKIIEYAQIDILGHLPLDRLHAEMRAATLNIHLYFSPVLFHHKLFELLAANRPILSFPGESEEAQNIADETNGRLYRCETPVELIRTFELTLANGPDVSSNVNKEKLTHYAWEAQAQNLEEVFQRVTATKG